MEGINIEELITANLGQPLGHDNFFEDVFDIDQLDNFNDDAMLSQSNTDGSFPLPTSSTYSSDGCYSSQPAFSGPGVSYNPVVNDSTANAQLYTLQQHQLQQKQLQQFQQLHQQQQPLQRRGFNNDVNAIQDNVTWQNCSAEQVSASYCNFATPGIDQQVSNGLWTTAASSGAAPVNILPSSQCTGNTQLIGSPSLINVQSPTVVASGTSATASPLSEDVAIAALTQKVNLLVDAILQSRAAAEVSSPPVRASANASTQSADELAWLQTLTSQPSAAVVDNGSSLLGCIQSVLATSPSLSPYGQLSPASGAVLTPSPAQQQQQHHHQQQQQQIDGTQAALMLASMPGINALTAGRFPTDDITNDFGSVHRSPAAQSLTTSPAICQPTSDLSVFPYTPPESGSSHSSPFYSEHSNGSDGTILDYPLMQTISADSKSQLSSTRKAQHQAKQSSHQFVTAETSDESLIPSTSTTTPNRSTTRAVGRPQQTEHGSSSRPNTGVNKSQNVKKRKLSTSSINIVKDIDIGLKSEPDAEHSDDDTAGGYGDNELSGLCNTQTMRWSSHQPSSWTTLHDEHGNKIVDLNFVTECDKGFNFQFYDNSFVCQKKNHFQVTVQAGYQNSVTAQYVRNPETGKLLSITGFYVHFHGIKMETPTYRIQIEQSKADRSKHPLSPVSIEMKINSMSKVVVPRMHFSETTANNMRKRGRPNPDQRYFQLVVSLCAHHNDTGFVVAAQVSDKIIVRASNPGQFENDPEMTWIKGKTCESIFHVGNVGINTDNPDEALTVHGNIHLTGKIVAPSDTRVKKEIQELDTTTQLKNISKLKVYSYDFKEEFADAAGLPMYARHDTGVLAQDLQEVIPDAVIPTGMVTLSNGDVVEDLLVVNKDRIFFENIGAVKELCKVTSQLEMRIDEMEIVNKKLSKLTRTTSTLSVRSSISTTSHVCSRHRRHNCRSCDALRTHAEDLKKSKCSNRYIFIATIILVLIMTLCVVAITTLYLLSRPTSTSVENSNNSDVQVAVDQNSDNSSSATSYPFYTVLAPQLRSKINVINCTQTNVECAVFCCPITPTPTTLSTSNEYSAFSSTVANDDKNAQLITSMSSKQIEETTSADRTTDNGSYTSLPITESPITTDLNSANTTSGSLDGIIETTVAELNDSGVSLESNDATLELSAGVSTTLPMASVDSSTAVESALGSPTTISSTKASNDSSAGQIRRKRSSNIQELASLVTIYLVEANQYVTSDYCLTYDCMIHSSSNYSYSIPVNNTFPPVSLTAQFEMNSAIAPVDVVLCVSRFVSLCGSSNVNVVQNQNAWSWSLPVGFYYGSAYTFRMTWLSKVNLVCTDSSLQMGVDYVQFKLTFERSCS